MSAPSIDALLEPSSVAIVGGLSKPTGLGRRTLNHLQDAGFGGEIIQAQCAADARGADVALVAVPAAAAHQVVAELDGHVPATIVYSSGFEEAGAEPLTITSSRTRLIGPNSVGLYYAPSKAVLTFAAAFDDLTDCAHGSGVVLISQSGAFGARIVRAARRHGLHLDGFIGSGNETTYDAAQLAADLIASDSHRPRVLALYLESVRDAAALGGALQAASRARVPVVVLIGGRSSTGAQAAQSHTAAVTGDGAALRELCRAHHAHLVRSDRELVDAMIGLSVAGPAGGARIGVVTGSGGAGVVAADVLSDARLTLPALSQTTTAALADQLPKFAAAHNPVDVTAQTISDTQAVTEVCRTLADSGEVDALLVIGHAEQAPAFAAATETLPIVTAVLDGDPDAVSPHIAAGVPVLPTLDAGCAAVSAICSVSGIGTESGPDWPTEQPTRLPQQFAGGDVIAGLRAVAHAGVAVPDWTSVASVTDGVAAARGLGWPVVLKANVNALQHKAAGGLLALDVAAHDIEARMADMLAKAREVVIVKQLRAGLEIFIGVRRDPMFGRVIAAGLGGGNVELIDKVVAVPQSVSPAYFTRRLADIFHRPGTEHLPDLITDTAARLYRLAVRYDLDLVECNPLVEIDNQLTALDARVLTDVNH